MEKHNLELRVLHPGEINEAWLKFKEGLYKVSVESFGWDENFQRDRFMKAYDPSWFNWLCHNEQKVGYVCFVSDKKELHVHLIIIDPSQQGKGYGKEAMNLMAGIARSEGLPITLSTLKNNNGAIGLYKSLGYEIINEDQYFLEMKLLNP